MLKNILASIGVGAAVIKLKLSDPVIRQGGSLSGKVCVCGGSVVQRVEQLYLHLNAASQYAGEDKIHIFDGVVVTFTDGQPFAITGAEFRKEIPFTYQVPPNIPLSLGRTRYQLLAGLDIRNAINPFDQIDLTVRPCPEVECLLQAFDELGFQHTRDSGDYNGRLQWMEFKPTDFMHGYIKEIKAACHIDAAEVKVFMHINRVGSRPVFTGRDYVDGDEGQVTLSLSRSSLLTGGKPETFAARTAIKRFLAWENH